MRLRRVGFAVLGGVLGVASLCKTAQARDLFDKPLTVMVTPLPVDQINPQEKRQVVCSVYPSVIVKVVDYGEIGALQLSILPHIPGMPLACAEANLPDEYVIRHWAGYFYGLKSGYAFFTAEDGTLGGGMGFIIVRLRDRQVVFGDVADISLKQDALIKGMSVNQAGLRLHYRRSYMASCSVITDGVKCLDNIVAATGLTASFQAICARSYHRSGESAARQICSEKKDPACFANTMKDMGNMDFNASPTAIAYDAEALIASDATEFDLTSDSYNDLQALASKLIKPKGRVLGCIPLE